MSTRFLYFIPLLVAVLLTGIFAVGLLTRDANPPSPLVQKPLPDFSLPVLEGKGELSPATLKGKYSLLNIFASWCVSCRVEHPLLLTLGKQIPIYGIAWKDRQENTRNWLERHGNPYTTVGMDRKGNTIIDLGVTGAPETFLINPEGKVLFRYAGPLTEQVVKESILPLIRAGK